MRYTNPACWSKFRAQRSSIRSQQVEEAAAGPTAEHAAGLTAEPDSDIDEARADYRARADMRKTRHPRLVVAWGVDFLDKTRHPQPIVAWGVDFLDTPSL
jgi:hypothetical protein